MNILAFLLLSMVIFLLYTNTLDSPFTFDDTQITENYFIRVNDLSWDSFKQVTVLSPNKNRLLSNLSFALNYYLDGFNVTGFHLVNIFIHISTAFTFFLLARTTLLLCYAGHGLKKINEIALAAALLWALHPLQTNGVTYIVQRMTSMAALFFLISLYCYIQARLHNLAASKILLFSLSLLFGVMALFSKENSAMLPVIIFAYEFYFLAPSGLWRHNRLKINISAICLLVIFLLICFAFLGPSPIKSILAGYASRDFTLTERLLTQSRVITHYLSLLLLPLPARMNLAYDFPFSISLLVPLQTLPAILFIAVLIFLVYWFFKGHRLLSFALSWFLANLFIESSFIPLEIIFEHRMYLPSMFLFLVLVSSLYWLTDNMINVARIFTLAIIICLAVLTWQRNFVWQSEIMLWSDVVKKSPNLPRAYGNLAKAYGAIDDHRTAQELLQKALQIEPEDQRILTSLGAAAQNQNRYLEALDFYSRALEANGPERDKIHRNLSSVYLQLKKFSKAAEHAREAIGLDPYNYDNYILSAAIQFKSGNLPQAENTLQEALKLFPEKGDIYVQLAAVYENQSRLQEAVRTLGKALASKDVDRAQAFNTLGIVYWRLRDYPRSVTAAKQALKINPQLLDAYLTLGITYEDMGQQDLALEQFIQGWQHGLDIISIFNDWAQNLMKMNQFEQASYYLKQAVKLEPERIESHENLAAAYQALGMSEQAGQEREVIQKLRNR